MVSPIMMETSRDKYKTPKLCSTQRMVSFSHFKYHPIKLRNLNVCFVIQNSRAVMSHFSLKMHIGKGVGRKVLFVRSDLICD